ncbi:hypothetical protein NECAME_06965 [Necator americanus]|uniref:Uncharacterized protein n=1 Tax=Necator americanus TaxID=51031 RepID=W2TSX6_NECAM|nr:hypothetical protein NECAME_06965 [Necator americanus]ETN84221.1 hypothetical protein NECAME_06965 [Necator americanus]
MIAFSFRQFTAVPDEPIKIDLTFEPLSEEKIAKAAESYRAQERTIQSGMQGLNNLQLFTQQNSDPLPGRKFVGLSAAEMCETGKADCVTPFARIRPLIVTAPNYNMMSCITQKSMSTVMSAIFCFLIREKEFIDAGRSILREYSDIRVGDSCFGCKTNMTCFLEEEYKRALEYAFADKYGLLKPSLTLEDLHVFPLNWRCNMEEFYGKYEFIRYSNDPGGTLLADLKLLLQRQNIPESSINYIAESLQSGRTAHSTVASAARTYLEKRIRSSPYLMELIVRLFYNDYKLFKYDLPDLDMLPVRLPQD